MVTLDRKAMMTIARDHAKVFQSAEPFPHVVIDDLLPSAVVKELAATFPGTNEPVWRRYDAIREMKLALEDETLVPECHRQVMRELNGQVFVDFLEAITGVNGLVPDPHFRGGGLHQIAPGGFFKIHADFDMHPRLHLRKRFAAILYLNEDWSPGWGGDLELWDKHMRRAVTKISPIINRLVVFSTTDTHYHGHPDPLACPSGRTRRSMAWYYYSADHRARQGHTSLFRSRPGEDLGTRGQEFRARVIAALPPSITYRARRLAHR